MKFLVKNYTEEFGTVHNKPVHWIKAFREEVGCGLKEAKHVCDYLRNNAQGVYHVQKTVEIDSNDHENLKFLEQQSRIISGFTRMILAGVVPNNPQETVARKVLENAARRLIGNGSYKEARKVLKILI